MFVVINTLPQLNHEKVYENNLEETERSKVFAQNLQHIKEHNEKFEKGLVSYTMGVTEFADLTVEEFKTQYLNELTDIKSVSPDVNIYSPPVNVTLPSHVDWRQQGAVTPVKHERNCMAGWAFSAVGAIESQLFLKSGNLTSLSAQNLIDCSTENLGCFSGFPTRAFEYIANNGGIDTEDAYPYLESESICYYDARTSKTNITGYTIIQLGKEDHLAAAVALVGPVAVGVDAVPFQFYSAGIIEDTDCRYPLTHVVLVVGYGTSPNGQDYWIVKNSWGKKFGLKGYALIARNKNACHIADLPSFPNLV
ncbi:hypothetical protein ILUMI_20976 [Ignelater luminosus]|uniref:Uncharacterized protein n=1 Tax=Ignelater luminosus TaxID=2038154 RepID=A0A8K0FYE8_IGNLU|nr:hypothetical protein ILUMI_20976 [Ignelater luminosus]